jgi:hypothetical protein
VLAKELHIIYITSHHYLVELFVMINKIPCPHFIMVIKNRGVFKGLSLLGRKSVMMCQLFYNDLFSESKPVEETKYLTTYTGFGRIPPTGL